MCGRFTQSDPERIFREFSVVGVPAQLTQANAAPGRSRPPRYNIAPTQSVAVLREHGPGRRRTLDELGWGLVPAWARDPSVGNRMINARVETLATKPAFRDALRLRRCLVVADGFYEWRREGRSKQPYYVKRRDGALLAMAGLWEKWTSADGEIRETFTVITKPAVSPVAEIHDRMPAVLPEPDHDRWLDASFGPPEALISMLVQASPPLLAVPVSSAVNRPSNDGPENVAPVLPIALAPGLFDRVR